MKETILDKIRESIEQITEGKDHVLARGSFGKYPDMERFLQNFFGVAELSLRAVQKDATALGISGRVDQVSYLGCIYRELSMALSFQAHPLGFLMEVRFSVDMEPAPFAYLGKYFQLHIREAACTVLYCFQEGMAGPGETFLHRLTVFNGNDRFPELCLERIADSRWSLFDSRLGKGACAPLSIEEFFRKVNCEAYVEWFPEEVLAQAQRVSLTRFMLVFDSEDTSGNYEFFSMELTLDAGERAQWRIMEGLSLKNLWLGISAWQEIDGGIGSPKRIPDLYVGGTFLLKGREIPVTVGLEEKGGKYSLSIGSEENVKIGGLEELAAFTRETLEIGQFLPEGHSSGQLYFKKAYLAIETGEEGEWEFSITVGLEENWKVLDFFILERLELYYEHRDGKNFAVFTGSLNLGGVPFGLEISCAEVCSIVGYTLKEAPVPLGAFVGKLAGGTVDLPRFCLEGLMLQCIPSQSTYSITASVVLGEQRDDILHFQFLQAKVHIDVRKREGEWELSGEIQGTAGIFHSVFKLHYAFGKGGTSNKLSFTWCPDDTFSLSGFLASIGAEGGAFLEDLNLSIKEAGLSYDLDTKAFTGEIETSLGKGVLLALKEPETGKQKTVFLMGVPGGFSFSRLPVAGKLAPALGSLEIQKIGGAVANVPLNGFSYEDIVSDLTMEAGGCLFAGLKLADGEECFVLPLYQKDPEKKGRDRGSRIGGEYEERRTGRGVEVNLALGPFSLESLLVSYQGGTLWLGVAGRLSLGILRLSLDGLWLGLHLPDQAVLARLDGLGISAEGGGVSVGGSLLRQGEGEYAGSVNIGLSNFSIRLFGAYKEGEVSSLFAFGVFRGRLGGTPSFQVTALGAGFGFQRSLPIPELKDLERFPLMKALDEGADLDQVEREADRLFAPREKALWVAAGIAANSFKMIEVRALLTAFLGKPLEIDLLGSAVMNFPHGTSTPVAHGALMLKACVKPEEGVASIEGMLSEDSYVLSKNVHLTGGFAFYTWFQGKYRGDFVVTFGGYWEQYRKPSHYPAPQRLGLSWKEGDCLVLKGEAYFALTPSCLMAGGMLHLDFEKGPVHAWLDAGIHALVGWKPFYYELGVRVSIGVKVKLWFIKVSLELGCDLLVWGPDLSGRACISLSFISFTISFGNTPRGSRTYLTAGQFAADYLEGGNTSDRKGEDPFLYDSGKIFLTRGVLREEEKGRCAVAAAQTMEITVKTGIPFLTFEFRQEGEGNEPVAREGYQGMAPEGTPSPVLRPCGGLSIERSHCIVTLSRTDGKPVKGTFLVSALKEKLPAALWADARYEGETLEQCTGLLIVPASSHGNVTQTLAGCLYQEGRAALSEPPVLVQEKGEQERAAEYLKGISSPQVCRRREALLERLGLGQVSMDLSGFERPEEIFLEMPEIVSYQSGTLRGGEWLSFGN